jgi:hypothetical protein
LLSAGPRPIDSFAGNLREGLIDAGMAEPPLVDTNGPRAALTEAGRAALAKETYGRDMLSLNAKIAMGKPGAYPSEDVEEIKF